MDSSKRDRAALFDEMHFVDPSKLGPRMACLSPLGVNHLLQRWVHHSNRVVVETHRYDQVTCGPYEEADITEDWWEERMPDGLTQHATNECLAWLRQQRAEGGLLRQQ